MVIRFSFLIMLLLSLLPALVHAGVPSERRPIIIAGDSYFPPYEFVDTATGGKVYRGFNVDIMKAIALQTGLDMDFRPMTWAEAMSALDRGEVDMIEGITYDEGRTNRYDFSDEYIINDQAIFVRPYTHVIIDTRDLSGRLVAVQKDDIAHVTLKETTTAKFVLVRNLEEALKLLVQDEVHAVAGNKLACQYILQKHDWVNEVKMVGPTIGGQRYCMAVQKGNLQLLSTLNDGLKEIRQNGTYDRIYAKWFGSPIELPAQYYKKYLLLALFFLALLGLVILIFVRLNFMLQKEVQRRADEMERVNQELVHKDKMEALGNLAASIAHEIRTPLTSIKTFAELLPNKFENPSFREQISKYVPQEVERINNLVNDLLNYANPRKAVKESVCFQELIDNILFLFHDRIEKSQVVLVKQINPAHHAFLDVQQMKQVLINMIMNALQAMDDVPEKKLTLQTREENSTIILAITDSGKGIHPVNRERIFEPFFSTKKCGTGLGLFVSYRLIKENGGTITVQSTVGEGTTFLLQFPNPAKR